MDLAQAGGTSLKAASREPSALWFDARRDADARRIRDLERGFRRDGLPNLIVDLSASDDIFTRSIPSLTLVLEGSAR